MVMSMVTLEFTTVPGTDAPLMGALVYTSDAGQDSPPMLYESIHFKSCWGINAGGAAYWTDTFAPDNEAAVLSYDSTSGEWRLTRIAP